MFMMAQFTPDGIQILTCGTDRKIAYWETLDCSLVREIEGSSAGTLNCVDITPDGRYFVTGSNDCTVKIWEYDSADVVCIGVSHAAIITACKFSPDGKRVVTASADGAIIIWNFPCEAIRETRAADRESTRSLTQDNDRRSKVCSSRMSERGDEGVAADRTARSAEKSTSSQRMSKYTVALNADV